MEQPNWLDLPLDLLEPIAQRSRDAITGVTLFRSVCRTWRAAVRQTPRLLLRPNSNGAGAEHTLMFPLSQGWLIVVDARDASCRLLHLATGATAALPKVTAVRYGNVGTPDKIDHLGYEHYTGRTYAERDHGITRCSPASTKITTTPAGVKVRTCCRTHQLFFGTYIELSDWFRFAVHVPPAGADPAASTDGIIVTMYHWMHGMSNIVVSRPGDVAWTKMAHPYFTGFLCSLAYLDGKIFALKALDGTFITEVFDAAMREFLHQTVDGPQATTEQQQHSSSRRDPNETEHLKLVAVPSKLLLVRVSAISFDPKAFTVFELVDDGALISWREVTGNVDDGMGGCYDLYLDRYHATFSNSDTESGTRVYFVLGRYWTKDRETWNPTISAYCYHMKNREIECVYTSQEDACEYSTPPGWFIP